MTWHVENRYSEDAEGTRRWGDYAVGTGYVTRYTNGKEYAEISYYVEPSRSYSRDEPDTRWVTTCEIIGPWPIGGDPDDYEYDTGSAYFYPTQAHAEAWCREKGDIWDESFCFLDHEVSHDPS